VRSLTLQPRMATLQSTHPRHSSSLALPFSLSSCSSVQKELRPQVRRTRQVRLLAKRPPRGHQAPDQRTPRLGDHRGKYVRARGGAMRSESAPWRKQAARSVAGLLVHRGLGKGACRRQFSASAGHRSSLVAGCPGGRTDGEHARSRRPVTACEVRGRPRRQHPANPTTDTSRFWKQRRTMTPHDTR
jgi:hypothetical protein